MTSAPVTGRAAFDLLRLGRSVAAELAGEAVDRTTDLPLADRYALAVLSLAVDAEASRRAGAEPLTERARAWLADELAAIERQIATTESIPPATADGQPQGHHHAPT